MNETSANSNLNAGHRLWAAQKASGTGLCIGLDPHYDPEQPFNAKLYMEFPKRDELDGFHRLEETLFSSFGIYANARFLAGATSYFLDVIDVAWANGIRVLKPQSAFYERFLPFGPLMLAILCRYIADLAEGSGEPVFTILDAKRGDIMSTQAAYYQTYLSGASEEVYPGCVGLYDFDTMTVTTWMGEDVLTPGVPWFRKGKGAIVVTRSSNPTGETLQEAIVRPNDRQQDEERSEHGFDTRLRAEVSSILERPELDITAHELMLHETERFSRKHELNQDGVSPIFSVMGSTVPFDGAFRRLRPNGIGLVPGWGHQGGGFKNVKTFFVREGPLAGHLGILSSSRAHNYSWMKKYGGAGDPRQLGGEISRAIDRFRKMERDAYRSAGVTYPF